MLSLLFLYIVDFEEYTGLMALSFLMFDGLFVPPAEMVEWDFVLRSCSDLSII
jgi:hypothetical protein